MRIRDGFSWKICLFCGCGCGRRESQFHSHIVSSICSMTLLVKLHTFFHYLSCNSTNSMNDLELLSFTVKSIWGKTCL